MGRIFSLCLPAKYCSNIKLPRPGGLACVTPCPCSWQTWWSFAFLQGSTQTIISMSILSGGHWRITAIGNAANVHLTVGKDGQKSSRGTLYPPEMLINQIRTFCGNVSALTNLLTKHRHISKLTCQAGFSQKPAQFHASLPTQLLSSLPSSLLGKKKCQAFRFPSAMAAPWIKYLHVGWPWACRLFITNLEWSSTLKAGKTRAACSDKGRESCNGSNKWRVRRSQAAWRTVKYPFLSALINE